MIFNDHFNIETAFTKKHIFTHGHILAHSEIWLFVSSVLCNKDYYDKITVSDDSIVNSYAFIELCRLTYRYNNIQTNKN